MTSADVITAPRTDAGGRMGAALRRFWPLTLLLGIIGAALGVGAGLAASPTYTSSASFMVGTPAVTAQAVPGYVAATQALAATYSLAAQTPQLTLPVSRQIGLSPSVVQSRVSVTELPGSNVIILRAKGPSAGDAHRLAAAAGRQLILLVRRTQSYGVSSVFLAQYQAAQIRLIRQQARLQRLVAVPPSRLPPQNVIIAAKGSVATSQLQVEALAGQYVQAATGNQAAAGLQILSAPGAASNDRASVAQKTGFIGLAAGVLLGLLLAYSIEVRRSRPTR